MKSSEIGARDGGLNRQGGEGCGCSEVLQAHISVLSLWRQITCWRCAIKFASIEDFAVVKEANKSRLGGVWGEEDLLHHNR